MTCQLLFHLGRVRLQLRYFTVVSMDVGQYKENTITQTKKKKSHKALKIKLQPIKILLSNLLMTRIPQVLIANNYSFNA